MAAILLLVLVATGSAFSGHTVAVTAFSPPVVRSATAATARWREHGRLYATSKKPSPVATTGSTVKKTSTTTSSPPSSWKKSFPIFQKTVVRGETPSHSRKAAAVASTNKMNDDDAANATDEWNPLQVLMPLALLLVTGIATATTSLGFTGEDAISLAQSAASDPQALLQSVITSVQDMGPAGALYFGLLYLAAELLAVPATPLTLSAGTLFGWGPGTAVVLGAGGLAACIGFGIGKTFLRSYVERIVADNPKFSKLDQAIGKNGFKLLVLVRLSPIFPFSITNYIYGSSSIEFAPYILGTMLGFTPSAIAYVYTGMVGQELLMGDATQPWYVYALGLGALLTLLKLVTEVATGLVEAIEEETEGAER
jgi:uncharacterized membrane protein YdjX (TVP38/TMEM64 family)